MTQSQADTSSSPDVITCSLITKNTSPPFISTLKNVDRKYDDFHNNGSVRAASRKSRIYVMRSFLVHSYSSLLTEPEHVPASLDSGVYDDYQSRKTVVLDVAGGKGDLSWLLTNLHSEIDSIVVDPRATNHTSIVKSALFLKDYPHICAERSVEGKHTYQPLAKLLPELMQKAGVDLVGLTNPRSLRIHVDDELVRVIKSVTSSSSNTLEWEQYWMKASSRANECYEKINPLYCEPSNSTRILSAAEAFHAIQNAKLLVGFHPDQATESIIDLAIYLKISFCVVPCCVFPSEFPNRVVKRLRRHDDNDNKVEGNNRSLHCEDRKGDLEEFQVKSYSDFVEYLVQKYPRMRKRILKFDYTATARNLVLYTLPEDMI